MDTERLAMDDKVRFPRFVETPVFDPDEFSTAFNFAMNAVLKDGIVENPTNLRFRLLNEDKSVDEMAINDTPVSRIIIAMKERYSEHDKAKYVGAASRILALIRLVEDGKLSQWVKESGDDTIEIHTALVHAAALVRLTKNGTFPPGEFVNKVKQLLKTGLFDKDFDKTI
jgi:hypothetical protein